MTVRAAGSYSFFPSEARHPANSTAAMTMNRTVGLADLIQSHTSKVGGNLSPQGMSIPSADGGCPAGFPLRKGNSICRDAVLESAGELHPLM